jgi:hypothetical protein
MNKKRHTNGLLLLLSSIAVLGASMAIAGSIMNPVVARASSPSTQSIPGQGLANNAITSYLPPTLEKSIIDQTRNTNATQFAAHNLIGATGSGVNKTAGTNTTSAMNKTAGMMNKTAGTNTTSAMNKTAGMMNKTAATNTTSAMMKGREAINQTLKTTQNTNATSFAARNLINATGLKNNTNTTH